jgi:hypothetical protein
MKGIILAESLLNQLVGIWLPANGVRVAEAPEPTVLVGA